MLESQLLNVDAVSTWFHFAIDWTGFAVLAGLLAKAILPGRDPGGTVATIGIGLVGIAIGAGGMMVIAGNRMPPISPVGFLAATCGAFVLLLTHRILSGGTFFRPAEETPAVMAAKQSVEKPVRKQRQAA